MATSGSIPSYDLWSDAPGILFNKSEWETANKAHDAVRDFGSLPDGWPKQLTGPQAWTGTELERKPESLIHILSQSEIEEIDSAIRTYKANDLCLAKINRSNFPLPVLGPTLRQIARNIYNGIGVQILRGFPIVNYDKSDQLVAFLGINSWIGNQRLDQGASRGICHIKSIAHIEPAERGKIYVSAQDTNPQLYHSDAGSDIVGLMAVSLSGIGGASLVGSAYTTYNHLAKHRPDILRILAERKFRWASKGVPDEGVHLIHWKDGKLFLNFSTRTFIGYGEEPDRDTRYPALTYEEREAFAGWQWIMHQYSLRTELKEGDIEWVNNLHHQHAREGFTEDQSKPRHLLRVWLRDTEYTPELPGVISNKFRAMFSGDPEFFPADETEEDERRRQTGVFTAVCEDETAEQRLKNGGIGAGNIHVKQ